MYDNGVYIPAWAVIPWESEEEEHEFEDWENDDRRDRDACKDLD